MGSRIFLPKANVTELNGVSQRMVWQEAERILLPLYHPAAALRARDLRPRLEAGFAALREVLASAPGGRLLPRRPGGGRRR